MAILKELTNSWRVHWEWHQTDPKAAKKYIKFPPKTVMPVTGIEPPAGQCGGC